MPSSGQIAGLSEDGKRVIPGRMTEDGELLVATDKDEPITGEDEQIIVFRAILVELRRIRSAWQSYLDLDLPDPGEDS